MIANDSVKSSDEKLSVTLVGFDPKVQRGWINIKELSPDRARYYVTVKFSAGGQHRIDYKTFDVHKTSNYEITSFASNDSVSAIEIVFAGTD
jgi:hypothetical protein